MTKTLIQTLKKFVKKEIDNTSTVVTNKKLIISKKKDIPIINLGKLV